MDLDKIIQKAQEAQKPKSKKKPSTAASLFSGIVLRYRSWLYSIVPYRIFRKFNYRGTTWLFFLSLALALCCYMIPFDDFSPGSIIPTILTYTSILLATVFVTLFLGVELYTFIRYPYFRNFPSKIPFEFSGWEEMIYKKELLDYENWWLKCSLHIELTNPSSADPKALEALKALCFFLRKKCNRQFYAPFLNETRNTWYTEEFNNAGSANLYVLSVLYEFIDQKLKPFHNQTGLIKKVTLQGDYKFSYISRETSD